MGGKRTLGVNKWRELRAIGSFFRSRVSDALPVPPQGQRRTRRLESLNAGTVRTGETTHRRGQKPPRQLRPECFLCPPHLTTGVPPTPSDDHDLGIFHARWGLNGTSRHEPVITPISDFRWDPCSRRNPFDRFSIVFTPPVSCEGAQWVPTPIDPWGRNSSQSTRMPARVRGARLCLERALCPDLINWIGMD